MPAVFSISNSNFAGMSIHDKISNLIEEARAFKSDSKEQFEQFRIRFSGKKGELAALFAQMKDIEPAMRKEFGQRVNDLKNAVEEKINEIRDRFESAADSPANSADLSLPGEPLPLGALHPITIVRNKICKIFERIGYAIAEGPEIEDDWHNFTALNFPEIGRAHV